MQIPIIIALVILVVLFFVFFEVFHNVLHVALLLVLVILVVGVIYGFFLVKDAKEFYTVFNEEPSSYVLQDGDTFVTCFQAISTNISTFKIIEPDDIVLDGRGKVFIIKKDMLNTSFSEFKNVTGLSLESSLHSDENKVRAAGFMYSLFSTIKQKTPKELLNDVRDKNIIILPRTLVVKSLYLSPSSILRKTKSGLDNSFGDVKNLVTDSAFSLENATKEVELI